MKGWKAKLAVFLLLGVGATIYILWRTSDTQTVLRQVDALLESASVKRITLGDANQPLTTFQSLVKDPVTIHITGWPPQPSGTYSRSEAVGQLQDFRGMVRNSRMRRLETKVSFPTSNAARVEALVEADITWLTGSHTADRFAAELLFERSPEGWILAQAVFIHRPEK